MKIITPLPQDCYIALSGGIDSMFGLHFLTRNPRRKVKPLFFHHGTEDSENAFQFLKSRNIDFECGVLSRDKTKRESPEEFFRQQRYEFFSNYNKPIVTCHHLDDQVETWLMGAMFGKPRLIPYKRGPFIRPFLKVTKLEIRDYQTRFNLTCCEDQSNADVDIPRNRVRHNIVAEALKVNPGLYSTVKNLF